MFSIENRLNWYYSVEKDVSHLRPALNNCNVAGNEIFVTLLRNHAGSAAADNWFTGWVDFEVDRTQGALRGVLSSLVMRVIAFGSQFTMSWVILLNTNTDGTAPVSTPIIFVVRRAVYT